MNPTPRNCRRFAIAGTLLGCLALSHTAAALLIDFDDLADGTEVSTQYEALGLIVENGVITDTTLNLPPNPAVSSPNALYDLNGPGMVLHFVGTLPTFVSMYVTASFGDQIGIRATGPNGLVGTRVTDGWAGSDDDPPPVPRQFISFIGEEISRINLDAYYFRRADIHIDNLSFGRDASVPEPSTWALLGIGLALVAWSRLLHTRRTGA